MEIDGLEKWLFKVNMGVIFLFYGPTRCNRISGEVASIFEINFWTDQAWKVNLKDGEFPVTEDIHKVFCISSF